MTTFLLGKYFRLFSTGGGCGTSMIMPRPCTSDFKKLRFWCLFVSVLAMVSSEFG